MVNGPPCAVCGFTLRWLPQQNGWGCDRCQRMFPASGPGAPQPQAAPQAPSPWAPPGGAPQQPYQQQGFGRPPQQQPSYPPQQAPQPQWQPQQPYGQQPPSPYAQQPQGYGQQQPPYTPHPSHPPQPVPPAAAAGGKKGGKGLIIGGAIAAVAIAGGVVAFVLLRGGGGTKGGDGRDAVVKSTLAALGAGDADQMMKLADYPGLWAKLVDCSGKTPPRDKSDLERDKDEDEKDEDKDRIDPKKMAEKQRKALEKDILPLTKGAKIELVEITSKVPGPPKDKDKSDDDEDEDNDNDEKGFTLPVGSRMGKGCYSKVPMRFHAAKIKVKVTPKGEEPIEQDAKVGLVQIGNGFWLADPPHLNLGAAALARELTAMKDKVCKCDKAECASKLKEEFKDGPRYKEIDKQIDKLSDEDRKKIDKIEDEIKACERKLEGGEQLAAFEGFKNKVCACVDKACVDKVTQEMTVYTKTHSGDKLADDDTKKAMAIGEEMGKCIAKIDEAERMRNPPPDTGSGIGSTIGEATGTGGKLPAACAGYKRQLERLAACSKLPADTRKSMEDTLKMVQDAWKDYDRMPEAAQKATDKGCQDAADAMEQSIKSLGC